MAPQVRMKNGFLPSYLDFSYQQKSLDQDIHNGTRETGPETFSVFANITEFFPLERNNYRYRFGIESRS